MHQTLLTYWRQMVAGQPPQVERLALTMSVGGLLLALVAVSTAPRGAAVRRALGFALLVGVVDVVGFLLPLGWIALLPAPASFLENSLRAWGLFSIPVALAVVGVACLRRPAVSGTGPAHPRRVPSLNHPLHAARVLSGLDLDRGRTWAYLLPAWGYCALFFTLSALRFRLPAAPTNDFLLGVTMSMLLLYLPCYLAGGRALRRAARGGWLGGREGGSP